MAPLARIWQRLRQGLRLHWHARESPPGDHWPADLWESTLQAHGFLAALPASEQDRLRGLCRLFLLDKEFHGAHGLQVSDAMAVAVAAQACLPLLHLAPAEAPRQALAWYGDFVGIVLHPGPAVAERESVDEAGVVHRWREELAGEAMPGGPVMLSWPDVATAGRSAEQGYNVVIHEFAHKLDLRDGLADGCPPLPAGFMGHALAVDARRAWQEVIEAAWQEHREHTLRAQRFGQPEPWLDPYGAEAIDEFFAVACEAYFVNRDRFGQEFPALCPLFDAFFRPAH